MSYIVMARKWRPRTFADVVGQEHVVRTLKNALQANRISHAYLFTGPRGVGKTTTARLLSRAVNCLAPVDGEPCNHCARCEEIGNGSSTDVIEIDGASNGLVDDARELREKVKYAPATCRYKVLIIDEVHMMSNAAFNALLKTLEEPPAHTIFILATTEVHKVLPTIISRCQRFDFRRISVKEIIDRLTSMVQSEGVTAEEEALHIVARAADGSLRDAQSLLDQIISFSGLRVTAQDAVAVLGQVTNDIFTALVDAVAERRPAQALAVVEQLVNQGADLRQFLKDWVEYWRSLVIAAVVPNPDAELLNLSGSVLAAVLRQSRLFAAEELAALARAAATADDELRRTQHPRLLLELLLVRLCSAHRVVSLDVVWQQLQAMEQRVAGLPSAPQAAAAAGTDPAGNTQPADARPQEPPVSEAGEEPTVDEPAGEAALIADALEDARPATHIDRVRSAWNPFLQTVGQKSRRIQGLLKDVSLTAAEPGWVELTCASPYHLSGLEKEDARKIMEASWQEILGQDTHVRLKTVAAPAQPEDGNSESVQAEAFAEILRKEPLVQKAVDLFGGKIVKIIPKNTGGGKR